MNDKMHVSIYSQPWDGATHVAFVMNRDGVRHIAKPVDLVWVPLKEFQSTEPTIRLSNLVAQDLLTALAEALDEKGIKTDSDAKIAGTLAATKYHLEDLRSLVFKKA